MSVFTFIFFLSTIAQAQIFVPHSYWRCNSPTSVTSSGDTSNADFSTGTFSNTTLSGATVSLAVTATSGTFTSQTFDLLKSCGAYNGMTDFAWKTSLPFLKELH